LSLLLAAKTDKAVEDIEPEMFTTLLIKILRNLFSFFCTEVYEMTRLSLLIYKIYLLVNIYRVLQNLAIISLPYATEGDKGNPLS
tara:strand:+ start:522 stop:776 length:255 start_codon:yes stop_codon:yes gene_type:complete